MKIINLKKGAFAVGVALACAALPAAADSPFGGSRLGTDLLGDAWSTGASGDSLAWGEPGEGLGVLSFNPLGTFVEGASKSANELDFIFLKGAASINHIVAHPALGGYDTTTRFIDVTQGFFFTPVVPFAGGHEIDFVAPTGKFINPGDLFFVNVHFTAPLQAGKFSFAGDWINTSPVPEPETYAMLLAGLGLMGLVARRRRQNACA